MAWRAKVTYCVRCVHTATEGRLLTAIDTSGFPHFGQTALKQPAQPSTPPKTNNSFLFRMLKVTEGEGEERRVDPLSGGLSGDNRGSANDKGYQATLVVGNQQS